MDVNERIEALRRLMEEKGIDIYIVPTADYHQSEYVGEYFKARKYITGFSGSAGTAVITRDEAKLWTDGRYFIQAAKQLKGTIVELMKMGEPGVPSLEDYVGQILPEGGTIGFDGRVMAMEEGCRYKKTAEQKNGRLLWEDDLIDQIWEERPRLSQEPVFELDIQYAGETTKSKLSRIREVMRECKASVHLLTTLDDICWTLNIRGNDIAFFPLVLSYAIITEQQMQLYIDEAKLDDEIKKRFQEEGIVLYPYDAIYEHVSRLQEDEGILLDPAKLNYTLYINIPENVKKVERANPEILFKAMKNPVEIENIRKAELKDSVAQVRFMKWLKDNVGKTKITEMSASDKLDEFRREMGNFIRPSFEPISSFGEHSAMCHYTSSPETDVELREGNLFLMDTGAGFYEGSTDITRTYAVGEIPQVMKDHFTLVAVSNLMLADAKFLEGCMGVNLDILARKPFWDRGLNFDHGTGHGVGYLLNIHEGPAGIRWKYRADDSHALKEGMLLTDEPGIYIEGSHGVRLENELLVCKGEKNEYGQFMYFETLTYIPMDLDAVNSDMMSDEEKRLLNEYHKTVYEKVSPYLNDEEKEWLKHYTREI